MKSLHTTHVPPGKIIEDTCLLPCKSPTNPPKKENPLQKWKEIHKTKQPPKVQNLEGFSLEAAKSRGSFVATKLTLLLQNSPIFAATKHQAVAAKWTFVAASTHFAGTELCRRNSGLMALIGNNSFNVTGRLCRTAHFLHVLHQPKREAILSLQKRDTLSNFAAAKVNLPLQ